MCTQLTEKVSLPMRFILNLFRRYSEYPTQLGVSDFCRYDEGEINLFYR